MYTGVSVYTCVYCVYIMYLYWYTGVYLGVYTIPVYTVVCICILMAGQMLPDACVANIRTSFLQ